MDAPLNPMAGVRVAGEGRKVVQAVAMDFAQNPIFEVHASESDDGRAIFLYLPEDGSRKPMVYLRRDEATCVAIVLSNLLPDVEEKTNEEESARGQPPGPVRHKRPRKSPVNKGLSPPSSDR